MPNPQANIRAPRSTTRITRMAYSPRLWLMAIGWWNKINQCRKLKLNLTILEVQQEANGWEYHFYNIFNKLMLNASAYLYNGLQLGLLPLCTVQKERKQRPHPGLARALWLYVNYKAGRSQVCILAFKPPRRRLSLARRHCLGVFSGTARGP